MTTALIPTGHDTQGYTCVKALARHGVDTIVASETPGVPAGTSRYCRESISVTDPRQNLLGYRDDLLDIASRPSVQTVIPIRPEGAYLLSRYRDQFEAVTDPFVPSFERFRSAVDRVRLVEAAENAGVPVPSTTRLGAVDEWSTQQLVKSRYNVLAAGISPDVDPSDIAVAKSLTHLDAGEAPDINTIEEAISVQRVIDAIYRSSERGEAVRLD